MRALEHISFFFFWWLPRWNQIERSQANKYRTMLRFHDIAILFWTHIVLHAHWEWKVCATCSMSSIHFYFDCLMDVTSFKHSRYSRDGFFFALVLFGHHHFNFPPIKSYKKKLISFLRTSKAAVIAVTPTSIKLSHTTNNTSTAERRLNTHTYIYEHIEFDT